MNWRSLYIALLRLHPRGFRQRFADEMLWIFDEAAPRGSVAPLFVDALQSLCRQWLLRPGLAPEEPVAQGAAGAPVFLDLESRGLSRGALLNGALLSALTFAGVLYCASHGGGHWEGVQQIFYALEGASWNGTEDTRPAVENTMTEDVETLVRRIMRLDVDGDGKISRTERRGWIEKWYRDVLDHAYTNRDGDITEEELRHQIVWLEQHGWVPKQSIFAPPPPRPTTPPGWATRNRGLSGH